MICIIDSLMHTWLSLDLKENVNIFKNVMLLNWWWPMIEQSSSWVYLSGSRAILWIWLICLVSLPWYNFGIEDLDAIEYCDTKLGIEFNIMVSWQHYLGHPWVKSLHLFTLCVGVTKGQECRQHHKNGYQLVKLREFDLCSNRKPLTFQAAWPPCSRRNSRKLHWPTLLTDRDTFPHCVLWLRWKAPLKTRFCLTCFGAVRGKTSWGREPPK